MSKQFFKKACALVLTLSMVMSLFTGLGMAAETTTYDPPQDAMEVDHNIITGTAHRSGTPALGFMGINATSGFGMIKGGVINNLDDAVTAPALGIWGTNLNDSPDPYYWNYFYNFYARENGKPESSDALRNANLANNPVEADATTMPEYGDVSVSLSTRPDIAFGCASTAQNTDTEGYADQIATINGFTPDSEFYQEDDENYDPQLVAIYNGNIAGHIQTLHNLADAMDNVTEQTGKVGRYGDPQVIADNYEKYIYGTVAYIASKIASGEVQKKTVAIINKVNEDGTFELSDSRTKKQNAYDRVVEYAKEITNNLADTLETSNGTGDAKIATAADIAAADVVIPVYINGSDLGAAQTIYNAAGEETTLEALLESQPTYNDKMIIIENHPNVIFGIVMNSFENAMGFGYFDTYMYSDVLDLNPVEFCALFYQYICHINSLPNLQKVVAANFAATTLPDGIANTLPDTYDQYSVEAKIAEGLHYLEEHGDAFAHDNDLDPSRNYMPTTYKADWEHGMCSSLNSGEEPSEEPSEQPTEAPVLSTQKIKVSNLSKEYKVSNLKEKAKTFTVKATAKGKITFSKVDGSSKLSINKSGKVTVKKGTKAGTYKMTIKVKAAKTSKYKAASVKKTVKVVVKKNQTIKLSGLSKTIKASALKKEAKSFKIKVEEAKGKVTFSKDSGSSKLSISKSGKVTVKKGTKTGTYKMKIKVKAAATDKYAAVSGTKTVKVTVKK